LAILAEKNGKNSANSRKNVNKQKYWNQNFEKQILLLMSKKLKIILIILTINI